MSGRLWYKGILATEDARKMYRQAILLSAFVSLVSCGDTSPESASQPPPKAETAQITGTISYRERMALTPSAEVELQLLDVTVADAPAQEITRQLITDPGQVPISFSIDYYPSQIDSQHIYWIRAVIRDGGRMLFTTDSANAVLTKGASDTVDLMLIRIGQETTEVINSPNASLTETYWKLIAANGVTPEVSTNQGEPHLIFQSDGESVRGFSGCNSFNGTYALDGDRLKLGPLATTMMACADAAEIESAFMQALAAMDRIQIDGESLQGFAGNAPVLHFAAVYLP
jgi:putative lipoprotein